MNLPSVVTPPSIYHGFSTRNMFREEIFTPGKFTSTNTKNCGRRNDRNHREIKNGENYITLEISSKFGRLENMKITYSDPKYSLRISGKGLITSMGLKTIGMSKKKKQDMTFLMSV